MARRYDTRTTIFSPEGRLYQVEYAMEAISHAGTSLGILATDGILLAAERRNTNKLLDEVFSSEKIYKLNDDMVCSVAGITSDANVLTNELRLIAQRYLLQYGESIPCEQLVSWLCDVKQAYTQYGGKRPFGVSILYMGWDKHYGYQLYQSDPSGNYDADIMAIDKIKTSPEVAPKKSRLEMNVRQLLNKCELIAKQEAVEGNWRLKKYVDSLSDMITELKTGPDKPSKDLLSEYSKRASFLKGLIQTSTFNSPTEKRNIIKAPNFTSTSSSQEDMDSLLKYHQNMQEKVAENMVLLTKSLKEQSQIASTIIKGDTEALKKSSDLTDRNLDALKVESERLQEHSRSAWKCWLWIMLGLVMVIFINMVLLMKVMKKRKIEL
ncbi:hypothetical protein MSG28_008713 [Choristoneura fumiferana]|uniref:Uncharacterized protein n=1 Tax=Choristoneura fumiferana TaxID=7141 RepID=A0ACC0J7S2_CHOFU|nr:hypothetical protein MSG28_008713 [Choristoneura fumiferana]